MKIFFVCCAACFAALAAAGCTGASPRFTFARPDASVSAGEGSSVLAEEGIASYYADEFNGRTTSNGEIYDMHQLTAAHRTLPFGTTVRVTNRQNAKSVTVRINDRGPFKDDRIIDLSLEAATRIGMIGPGTAPVSLQVLELGRPDSTR
jgi:rare lipoprotein A